jgi:hypothetical protein
MCSRAMQLTMARKQMTQIDLFGHSSDQGELFGKQAREKREWVVNADTVRAKMTLLLETARNAEAMPWPPRKAKVYETIFPQMANWLPDEEADQMTFEFARELERLKLAA